MKSCSPVFLDGVYKRDCQLRSWTKSIKSGWKTKDTVLQILLLLNEFYFIATVIFKQNPNTMFLKFKLNI